MGKVAVVAIGGNSLIKDSAHPTIPDQMAAVAETCSHIAEMIEEGWEVVVTHGNGPQVGFLLLRSELASHMVHVIPLDTCGADTQGAIGYWTQQALYNEFRKRGMDKKAATVVTQTIVDRNDPAFQNPSKPIGPFYTEEQAEKYRKERGWDIREDAGRGWRRVVPSPIPKEIVERDAIKALIDAGIVAIAVGGGGIPVIRDEEGNLCGVEGVIDKDYGSSLLASSIRANLFLISTAVEKVSINYRKPNQRDLDVITMEDARRYLDEGHFPAGSMGPKIRAAIQFLEKGGEEVIITSPECLRRAIKGETGTRIIR